MTVLSALLVVGIHAVLSLSISIPAVEAWTSPSSCRAATAATWWNRNSRSLLVPPVTTIPVACACCQHLLCTSTLLFAGDINGVDDASVDGDVDDKDKDSPGLGTFLEGAVRAAGFKDYQFGDATKSTVRAAGFKDYEFGDIAKKTLSEVIKTEEYVVRAVTKNDDYRFGDITKGVIADGERVLEESVTSSFDSTIIDLPSQVQAALGGLTLAQGRKLKLQTLQCLGLGALSLNFVLNVCSGLNIVSSWAITCAQTGQSPFASAIQWSRFLRMLHSTRLFIAPALMPAQCAVAFFLFFEYWKAVQWTQKRLFPKRDNSRIIERLISMFAVYFCGNVVALASMTGLGVYVVTLLSGVPLR
jgi:hypothetical protein